MPVPDKPGAHPAAATLKERQRGNGSPVERTPAELAKELAAVKAERDQLKQRVENYERKMTALSDAWRLVNKNLG